MVFPRSIFSFALLLLLGTVGCDRQQDSVTGKNSPAVHKLFFFEGYPLHAAVSSDSTSGTLTLRTLGADAETVQPIKAQEIKLAMKHGNHFDKFTFKATPQAKDSPGTASVFSVQSRHLAKALAGKAGRSAELLLTLDGKQLVGRPEAAHGHHEHGHHEHGHHEHGHHEHEHHDHEHGHAAVNVLVWHKEFEFQGNAIRLGQHGLVVESGTELEPAVSIDREGQPVKNAKVSTSLLTADGKQILTEPQRTHFEPKTEEEPAHYAQAFLAVPKDAKQVTIRYRIDWEDGETTTRDVLIQTESHAH